MKKLTEIFPLVMILLAACTSTLPEPTTTLLPTDTPIPPTATTEPTLANTPLPPPTSTPEPLQILGRIFQDGYDSLGVSCNINTGSQDSQNTHFDVRVPLEFNNNPSSCSVISPVKGIIKEIYQEGTLLLTS